MLNGDYSSVVKKDYYYLDADFYFQIEDFKAAITQFFDTEMKYYIKSNAFLRKTYPMIDIDKLSFDAYNRLFAEYKLIEKEEKEKYGLRL